MRYDTLDAVLSAYEARWRAFALSGRSQFHGETCGGAPMTALVLNGTCALLLDDDDLDLRRAASVEAYGRTWTCGECGWTGRALSQAMMHCNNAHRHTWDWFANKFRDAWEAGLR